MSSPDEALLLLPKILEDESAVLLPKILPPSVLAPKILPPSVLAPKIELPPSAFPPKIELPPLVPEKGDALDDSIVVVAAGLPPKIEPEAGDAAALPPKRPPLLLGVPPKIPVEKAYVMEYW